MKKEEIYVEINNEAEQKRAIEILTKAGEGIGDVNLTYRYKYLKLDETWFVGCVNDNLTEITLDQLEQMLTHTIDNEIESFKERMKEKGFEVSVVIEKEIIQPDDVVMFYDNDSNVRSFAKYKSVAQCWDNIVKVTDKHVLKFLNL